MAEQRLWRAETPRARPVAGRFDTLTVVVRRPMVWVVDGFVDDDTADALRSVCERVLVSDTAATDGAAGRAYEVPVDVDPTVSAVAARMTALLGIRSVPSTLRYRVYGPGQGHPPHPDHYEIDGAWLVATALLCLTDVEDGGATSFLAATPPVAVLPRRGRLIAWLNHAASGAPDRMSVHEGQRVLAGEKVTLTAFLYDDPADCPVLRARERWTP